MRKRGADHQVCVFAVLLGLGWLLVPGPEDIRGQAPEA